MTRTLLNAQSDFSLLWGTRNPRDVVTKAAKLGYRAVALADRDALYGLPAFLAAAKRHDVRPVVAADVTDPVTRQNALLYPLNENGYARLCRILTQRHCHEDFNLERTLSDLAAGLAVVTDSLRIIARLDGHDAVYFRIAHNLKRPPPQVRHLPWAIAPPAIFFDRHDYELHRLMRAIELKQRLSSLREEDLADPRALFEPPETVQPRYAALPQAVDGARRLIDSLRFDADFSKVLFPEFPCPPGMSEIELLRCKTYEGARRRYGELSETVVARIERELDLIEQKGFAGYFLVVDEIVQRSPRICGRGSAAASIVSYSLGITNVDPIRHNLMFERFLNPGRKDPPDIDVDFPWDERDEVLDWVLARYGNDRAAMVANHNCFRPRMALRETARVFGLPEREITAVTHKLPWCWQTDDEHALNEIIRNAPRMTGVELDPPWPDVIRLAARLIGKPRQLSTHCGGVILTPGDIWRRVPVQPAAKGVNIVHWEKDGVEDLGLVKIDLLGNRSLAVIRDAVANLHAEGVHLDEWRWDPVADPKTQRLLASGQTMGVFYCESPAMRQLQIKTGRGDFEHLVINTSIIRPAANAYTRRYVERVHGLPYEPIHPLLADILAETYGIMIYQEDVSRVAMAMAGFSCEDADRLRKIMSKKDKELELAHYYRRFVDGARAKGVSDPAIDEVFQMIMAFSGYSFCKPHSASYTMVSYQSAYLKAHHPAAFMAAVMANHGGYYSTQGYAGEARRIGIDILRPNVNLSRQKFIAQDGRIVTGLAEIKGLTLAAQQEILDQRDAAGPYASLQDLLARTGLHHADAKRLILSGAFDRIEPDKNRPTLLWELKLHQPLARRTRNKTPAPSLNLTHPALLDAMPSPTLRAYNARKTLELEYDLLGFLATAHPLEVFTPNQQDKNWIKADALPDLVGKTVSVLSWPISAKTITTAASEEMEFVSLEDETALYEAVLFPRQYRRFANLLFCDHPVVVTGRVDEDFSAISLIVQHVAKA
ncbi:MAG: DNA polymerase III subunit alpha [Phycisphaerae bacterium]|nr:DNA polymerase III subunit alpha [Phycisphaerae bacterium]